LKEAAVRTRLGDATTPDVTATPPALSVPLRPVPEVRRATARHPAGPDLPGDAPRRRRPCSRRPG